MPNEMKYHPGPNLSKMRFSGGLPALLWVIFIVMSVGSAIRPLEYITILVSVCILGIALVPLLRRLRKRDSETEERLFGGHVFEGDRERSAAERRASAAGSRPAS